MQYKFLENINKPEDLKALSKDALKELCAEIRAFLKENISKTGGHLASNLGAVEMTVAIHRVFDSPRDKIVFDVGHQSYVHKLITGRREQFETLRKKGGLSGFTKPYESEHDPFGAGHSSTSISAALGIATAMKLKGEEGFTVAVIGDGALTGGLAYEGLNNAGRSNTRLIVILNDNELSISRNVGSIAQHLSKITSRPAYFRAKDKTKTFLSKIPYLGKPIYKFIHWTKTAFKRAIYTNIFEDLGFIYFGPIDGHNIEAMAQVMERAKQTEKPSVIHIKTVKGKGYVYAEDNPTLYHGVSEFDVDDGIHLSVGKKNFSCVFADALIEIAKTDNHICAITAAMAPGVGLDRFQKVFPGRFFDVGIAEGHAVTFSAGLAKEGMKPVFACYSSFLQRGYDEIIHDTAIQHLPVIFAIDRAGFVGEDGETHQGLFDVSMMMSIPGLEIYSPFSYDQLEKTIKKACGSGIPVAVRYPRGGESIPEDLKEIAVSSEPISALDTENADVIIISYGRALNEADSAKKILGQSGIKTGIVALLQIKPVDYDRLFDLTGRAKTICFVEEGMRSGGVGEKTGIELYNRGYKGEYKLLAVDETFVHQATVQEQYEMCGLDGKSISKALM
ncbi:MAG: 1-deoxy-D-xylulose-5-phosphate synthase [Bacillota bacterium]|nr:1-deoxy-D-xylulose-5-phosphate synthase [Bacillota bacterium]